MKSVDMVREGGLVAFITSQGVLNAEQGRPVREWLMNRCEPVSAIRLPNNLFTEHAGTEVGSDLVILQKKAATGELSERQRDFIESRKLSNGIRINNLFQSFDRVIHTEAKVGKDPYGKPAMEFTHAEGVDGIDREMRRMLSEDFNRHFNESYCLEHAPEQTPGTPERELSRPRQAERQRAERHEPRLAGEIVKEIIADARNLQTAGTITYKGKELTINQPQDAIKNGIAMLTEDRRATGILGVLSIADNVSIASLNKYLIGGIMLDDNKIEKLVQDNVAKLSIKTPSSKTQIQSLSGGNQQKVLIARWLANDPDVFIMDEPTRGIDVGAKYEIYCIIAEMAKQGKSIIMISSEMSELIGMSDRIMVMCDGRCTGFIDGDKANQENIMTLATQFE